MFKKWIDKIKKKKGGDEDFTGHMVDPGGGPSRRMSVPVTSSVSKKSFFKRANQKEEAKQPDEKTHSPIIELEEEEEQMALPPDFA